MNVRRAHHFLLTRPTSFARLDNHISRSAAVVDSVTPRKGGIESKHPRLT